MMTLSSLSLSPSLDASTTTDQEDHHGRHHHHERTRYYPAETTDHHDDEDQDQDQDRHYRHHHRLEKNFERTHRLLETSGSSNRRSRRSTWRQQQQQQQRTQPSSRHHQLHHRRRCRYRSRRDDWRCLNDTHSERGAVPPATRSLISDCITVLLVFNLFIVSSSAVVVVVSGFRTSTTTSCSSTRSSSYNMVSPSTSASGLGVVVDAFTVPRIYSSHTDRRRSRRPDRNRNINFPRGTRMRKVTMMMMVMEEEEGPGTDGEMIDDDIHDAAASVAAATNQTSQLEDQEQDEDEDRRQMNRQVQEWKTKAAEIRAEAVAMEHSLNASKTRRQTIQTEQTDQLIQDWFEIDSYDDGYDDRVDQLDPNRLGRGRSTVTNTTNTSNNPTSTVREVFAGILSPSILASSSLRDASWTRSVWLSLVPPPTRGSDEGINSGEDDDDETNMSLITNSTVMQVAERMLEGKKTRRDRDEESGTTIGEGRGGTGGSGSEVQVLQVIDRLWALQLQARIIEEEQEEDSFKMDGTVPGKNDYATTTSSSPKLLPSAEYSRRIATLVLACRYIDDQVLSSSSDSEIGGEAAPEGNTAEISSLSSSSFGERGQVEDSASTNRQRKRSWSGRTEMAVSVRIKELYAQRESEMKRRWSRNILDQYKKQGRRDPNEKSSTVKEVGSSEESQSTDSTTIDPLLSPPTGTSIVPMWVPSTFLPYIINSNTSTVGKEVVEEIKDSVLTGSSFYVTSTETIPGAALFRGNIRVRQSDASKKLDTINSKGDNNDQKNLVASTSVVFDDIQQRLANQGLDDRVQLFLLPDPEDDGKSSPVSPSSSSSSSENNTGKTTVIRNSREGLVEVEEGKPVILALSRALTPDESLIKRGWFSKFVTKLSYPAALLSTFLYSLSTFSLNPTFLDRLISRRELAVLPACLPVFVGTIAIQCIHEAVGRFFAKKRQIKIGSSIPIPSIHFTTIPFFGCITPIQSFPRNRAEILDFALSGPLSAIAVSLVMVFAGISLTLRATSLDLSRFPFVTVASMKSSFLLGTILSWMAPKTMMLPMAQPIPMHPCFVVGVSGLITNALNLLPIFRLDGGRACFAALGHRQGAIISVFTLLLLTSMAFSGGSSVYLTWMVLVLLLQRRDEVPPRDDCTLVDGKRQMSWFLSFLLSLSILSPFPGYSKLAL